MALAACHRAGVEIHGRTRRSGQAASRGLATRRHYAAPTARTQILAIDAAARPNGVHDMPTRTQFDAGKARASADARHCGSELRARRRSRGPDPPAGQGGRDVDLVSLQDGHRGPRVPSRDAGRAPRLTVPDRDAFHQARRGARRPRTLVGSGGSDGGRAIVDTPAGSRRCEIPTARRTRRGERRRPDYEGGDAAQSGARRPTSELDALGHDAVGERPVGQPIERHLALARVRGERDRSLAHRGRTPTSSTSLRLRTGVMP